MPQMDKKTKTDLSIASLYWVGFGIRWRCFPCLFHFQDHLRSCLPFQTLYSVGRPGLHSFLVFRNSLLHVQTSWSPCHLLSRVVSCFVVSSCRRVMLCLWCLVFQQPSDDSWSQSNQKWAMGNTKWAIPRFGQPSENSILGYHGVFSVLG